MAQENLETFFIPDLAGPPGHPQVQTCLSRAISRSDAQLQASIPAMLHGEKGSLMIELYHMKHQYVIDL